MATALSALPRRQREAFCLGVLEYLDVAQTALGLGCSDGSFKTHLSRARDTLKRQLEDFR
jgi:RNA polymerase sigma-70 factor (ECF subfamily)